MADTTRTKTIRRGKPSSLGWRDLHGGPGEDSSGPVPEGTVIGCIWHLSDLHICDAESPARIEYLDRYADPDSPYRDEIGEVGTYRPQELLTVQVASAMIETVNAIDRGPLTDAPVECVLITGDVTDNAQENELHWYSTLISGGTLHPGSGGPTSSWVGVSDPETWDDHYWHPDGPPAGFEPDRPMQLFGFPRIPGLIAAAREPFDSPGLIYEVLSVHGNHDALLQGTVAADAQTRDLAVGNETVVRLSDGFDPRKIASAVAMNGPASYVPDPSAPRRTIEADPRRAIVSPGDFADAAGRSSNYWVHDLSQIRVICLDTVNPFGGWQGSLDEEQFIWLEQQLTESTGMYVVISSHHPSPTMTNDWAPDGSTRVLGDRVVDLLLEFPNVLLWIAGHVHFNAAIQHGDEDQGFWEVTTSSLIDWPQQGRIFEFIDTGDRVAIVSTVVDHNTPLAPSGDEELDVSAMAGISRLLAANDYQRRDEAALNELREGSPEVRNCVWWINKG